jgi:predicted aconitase
MTISLSEEERRTLAGELGAGKKMCMELIVGLGDSQGASELTPITQAHVDGCLYHGQVSLDFTGRLLELDCRVAVPTTLNVGGVDLIHPELFHGDAGSRRESERLMADHRALGCRPTFTCAPYQLASKPKFGEQIAWGESNAITYANSVLGARTNRYGDFVDLAAAVIGKVPMHGLHTDDGRIGEILFEITPLPPQLVVSDALFPVLGFLVGKEAGRAIPVIKGLPADTTDDQLRALGAAAASSGSVAMFHAVGLTPEAETVAAALGDAEAAEVISVSVEMLRSARDALCTVGGGEIGAVSLGGPHLSPAELRTIADQLEAEDLVVAEGIDAYVNTSRHALRAAEEAGVAETLRRAGFDIVVDTCTYIAPIMREVGGPVMTNSAKWAHYAPANIGVEVVFGSLRECLHSARAGRVWRDDAVW